MKRKKKLDNSGYLLIETLIVSVFIMSVFTLLYTNLLPLMGEYDRTKDYNTLEATYVAHWVRKTALLGLSDAAFYQASINGYSDISDCSQYSKNNSATWCENLKDTIHLKQMYLTPYSLDQMKTYVHQNKQFDRGWKEYISNLPTYNKNTNKTPTQGYYRILISYEEANRTKYATVEVHKKETTKQQYQIQVENQTGGTLTVSKQQAIAGDTITIQTAAIANYKFQGATIYDETGTILSTLSSTSTEFIMPSASIKIVPIWAQDVIYYKAGLETVTGGTIKLTNIQSEAGKTVSFTVIPNSGFTYLGAYVLDASNPDGKPLMSLGQGQKSFTMPAKDIIISSKWKYQNTSILYLDNASIATWTVTKQDGATINYQYFSNRKYIDFTSNTTANGRIAIYTDQSFDLTYYDQVQCNTYAYDNSKNITVSCGISQNKNQFVSSLGANQATASVGSTPYLVNLYPNVTGKYYIGFELLSNSQTTHCILQGVSIYGREYGRSYDQNGNLIEKVM